MARFRSDLLVPLLAASLLSGATAAQPTEVAPGRPYGGPADEEDAEIVVQGQKPPGSVIGDIPPEQTLTPADIRAYGVNSVADLLNELSPQTTSGRGRGGEAPVVLLNGKRISSFAEIRDLPTEAIQRAEILPEEVALKYGFGADQKVVNFVLRRRFRSVTALADGGMSTDGGRPSGDADADLLRIHGDGRFHLDGKVQGSDRLLESQRDLVSTAAGRPFDLTGNVLSASGASEIDPRLSALAGTPVTVAGVPATAATRVPTLADFVGGPNATDISRYRTLLPATRTLTFNGIYSRVILGNVSATVNGTLTATDSDTRNGLPTTALTLPAGNPYSPFGGTVLLDRYTGIDPLDQRTRDLSAHLGFGLNGQLARWRWNLTGNWDRDETHVRSETEIDTGTLQARIAAADAGLNPFGDLSSYLGDLLVNRSRAVSNTGNLQLVANGPVAQLPAGPINTTAKLGGTFIDLASRSERLALLQDTHLDRQAGNGQINVDVPIASRRTGTLSFLGNLTLNGNIAVNQLSDFGTLRTYGYGLNWTPRTPITIIASFTDDQGPPTTQQLGNPVLLTPQTRVFDYQRGTTVDVTAITGGNPALRADDRRVWKLGATWKPLPKADLTLSANYYRSSIRNTIATLPEPTADIEAAFPERFLRDGDGNLIRVDARPVNFARERRDSLRYGLTFSIPLKPSAAALAAFRRLAEQRGFAGFGRPSGTTGDAPPPHDGADGRTGRVAGGERDGAGSGPGVGGQGGGSGRGGFGGGGLGGGRFRQNAGGRIQLALYDTWYLRSDVLVRPGVPLLDLLDGASIGATGGQPQHEVEGQLGYSNAGLGARLSLNYQTATRVRAGAASTTGDLRFSNLATVDVRLFANVGEIPRLIGKDWARNLRVTLSVTNLFNERQRVRDTSGDTPIRYQPAYLDPLGRSVRIGIRKLFASRPSRPVTRSAAP